MADEKLNTGPAENISPEAAEPITTPEQAAASEPQQEQAGPAIPESGDVVVSFDKINELMAEKRQNARAEVEKSETPETPEAAAPGETPQPANTEEPKKPRRGRPPKAEKAATENQKAEKSAGARKGRPPKADKAAPDKPKPSKRDKVSRSDGKAPDAKEPIKPAQDTALKETAAVEQTAPEPTTPPRPVEEGKLVYLKLSEVHPFHTFRPHPFKVRDDAKILHGMARFLALYQGEYSRERLILRLRTVHPKTITRLAQNDTGNVADRHMKQILSIYNGAGRAHSLPCKR